MGKLIYIIAAGHSGSTLLDLLTGSIPGVFSTGEVTHLPWQLHRTKKQIESKNNQNICTCLKSFRECEVWGNILNSLNNKIGLSIQEDPFKYRLSFNSRQAYGQQNIFVQKCIRAAGLAGKKNSVLSFVDFLAAPFFKKVIKNNWLLFDTICSTQKVEFVVDSSKDNLRMALLAKYRPEDTYVIVLKRNIYGFSHSHMKRGKNVENFLPQWIKFYDTTCRLLKNMSTIKRLDLTYEDLCKNPELIRQKIAFFIGIDCPKTELAINTREHHLVAGNPMRYNGNITIQYDNKWEKGLTKKEKIKINSTIPLSLRKNIDNQTTHSK